MTKNKEYNSKRKTILAIEDDVVLLKVYKLVFPKLGYNIIGLSVEEQE